MAIVLALLFGAFSGWAYSVLARSDTNEAIIVDILVGALGSAAMALALGNNSSFDSFVAAFLGAFVTLSVLHLVRGRVVGRR